MVEMNELTVDEAVITSCRFKGSKGLGCHWMKDMKKAFQGMKPKDWLFNDCFLDGHYKIH